MKICIVAVYFGSLPNYFPLWLNSCKSNESIDFLLITDQNLNDQVKNIKNIRNINITFNEFQELVQSKFEFVISLEKPYKICDFRPSFGLIFEEKLRDYDFWGYCDFDMIFGDIRMFFSEEILQTNDKILSLGHLSIYKNTEQNNIKFKSKGSLVGDYRDVYTSNKSLYFDEERGILEIFKEDDCKIYDKRIFADISDWYNRFRLSRNDKNYEFQVFSYEGGKIYREFVVEDKIYKEEFLYIHMKRRKNLFINFNFDMDSSIAYYITNKGFFEKSSNTNISDINRYNKYSGRLFELYEIFKFKSIRKYKYLRDKHFIKASD